MISTFPFNTSYLTRIHYNPMFLSGLHFKKHLNWLLSSQGRNSTSLSHAIHSTSMARHPNKEVMHQARYKSSTNNMFDWEYGNVERDKWKG